MNLHAAPTRVMKSFRPRSGRPLSELMTSPCYLRGACSSSKTSQAVTTPLRQSGSERLLRSIDQQESSWRSYLGRVARPISVRCEATSTKEKTTTTTQELTPATPEATLAKLRPSPWWWTVPVLVGLASLPLGFGVSPVRAYNTALEAYPFYTKLATGVAGSFIGDFAAQAFPPALNNINARRTGRAADIQPFVYDPWRAARFMIFSAVISTPANVVWFAFLDRAVMPGDPTSMTAVATKVAMDQLMMAPTMTTAFFITMAVLAGDGGKALDAVRSKLVPTMKVNYLLWPAAHTVNFAFVSSDQRILYINCVAVVWSVVLSAMAAAPTKPEGPPAAEAAGGDAGKPRGM